VQDRPSEGPISPSAPDPQRASVRCGERRVDRFLQARCGGHFGARGRGGAHLRMGAVGRCHLVRLRAWCVPFCGAGDVEIPRDLSVTRSSGPRRPVPCWSQGCRLCLERCPHRTVSSGNLVPSGTGCRVSRPDGNGPSGLEPLHCYSESVTQPSGGVTGHAARTLGRGTVVAAAGARRSPPLRGRMTQGAGLRNDRRRAESAPRG
jgi:hypothetical protein